MNKNRGRYIFLGILLSLFFSINSYAAEIPVNSSVSTEENTITPRAEQVKWYYRKNTNGVKQKRLWSITYGYWKTGWINV